MEALQRNVIKDILRDSFIIYSILLFSMFHLSSFGNIKINEGIFYSIAYFAIQYFFVIVEAILSLILFYLKRVKKISSHFFVVSILCVLYIDIMPITGVFQGHYDCWSVVVGFVISIAYKVMMTRHRHIKYKKELDKE